ncbi:MAG: pyridoxal phosphate-dependent aminotransferase [Desulfobacteraceae bacterium]|nr:pyridoxal phosphate-dependent aminotransferase [Desulfobacteraceae bacterium]
MRLSRRIRSIEASGTSTLFDAVEKRRRSGQPVINLAIGEPDFFPAAGIIDATTAALANGQTRYTNTSGLEELRNRLGDKPDGYSPENIIITNGAKQGLYGAFQVLLDPGDEVILPSPHWVSFGHQIRLAGGTPVVVPTVRHQLDVPAIEAALTASTRAILINSPNNPTGAVYPKSALDQVAGLAETHDLTIVSDETYDTFVYNGTKGDPCPWPDEIRHRLIRIRSFSKQFSMTGFRVGCAIGPDSVISAMGRLQGHVTGNVCTFAQHGALAALSLDPDEHDEHCLDLMRKRDLAHQWADDIFSCIKPEGAFYLFPDVRQHLAPGQTSADFAAWLLERAGVAVVPGEDFGASGYIRICFAVPENILTDGLKRIKEVL